MMIIIIVIIIIQNENYTKHLIAQHFAVQLIIKQAATVASYMIIDFLWKTTIEAFQAYLYEWC